MIEMESGIDGDLKPVRVFLLDACSIVKFIVQEPGYQNMQQVVRETSNVCRTTWLCLGEAYGVIKSKMRRGELQLEQYLKAAYLLARYAQMPGPRTKFGGQPVIRVEHVTPTGVDVAQELDKVMRQFPKLDYSDALLLLCLESGPLAAYSGESRACIVTSDGNLKAAARHRGLPVFDPEKDTYPPTVRN